MQQQDTRNYAGKMAYTPVVYLTDKSNFHMPPMNFNES